MKEKTLLKDKLFNKVKVEKIAKELHRVHLSFMEDKFVHDVIAEFPKRELKARISWIAECLKKYLPNDYNRAVDVLVKSLPASNNPELSDNDFGDFIYASYAEFIAKNGCTKANLPCSLNALHEITQRFSAEDAIRHFIDAFPKETMKKLLKWSTDKHYHVRRLCSEGTRPKLPWSKKINISIREPLPIINQLYDDKTRFVTRSVANHINDISKINPNLSMDILKKWQQSKKQNKEEMDYIIRHSLRTLIKQGNTNALKMLGFSDDTQVIMSNFIVPKQVKMNTLFEFSFTIKSDEDTKVLFDYILYFQNKSGRQYSKKVYKLTTRTLTKNKSVTISKKHKLNEQMTTRKLFRGKQAIEIQINGNAYGKKSFQLV